MSTCVSCPDRVPACACNTATEVCIQRGRSCGACPVNICQPKPKSGSKTNIGATAGGALGGILGICAALALAYFFWWKPRGLAASRKRLSRHISNRQSKLNSLKSPQSAGFPLGTQNDRVTKRTSVHLGMEGPNGLQQRTSGGVHFDDESIASTAHATRATLSSELDDPFGDQNRSSLGSYLGRDSHRESDFSFRSSTSTNIIPIAYIPPHSASMSIADASRDGFGELNGPMSSSLASPSLSASIGTLPSPTLPRVPRLSVPASLASHDSLILAGADLVDLNPMPPVVTADKPSIPLTTPSGKPIRPPRSPGLDLELPKPLPSGSPTSTPGTNTAHLSGFPWSSAPPAQGATAATRPQLDSKFSTSTTLQPPLSPSSPVDRVHNQSQASHLSTVSMMSDMGRSTKSTMSYILDPPQIITPVDAQGIKRVELMGRGQAGLVRIAGSSAGTTPAATAQTFDVDGKGGNPFADDQAVEFDIPLSAISLGGGLSPTESSGPSTARPTSTTFGGDLPSPLLSPTGHQRQDSQSSETNTEMGYETSSDMRYSTSSSLADELSGAIAVSLQPGTAPRLIGGGYGPLGGGANNSHLSLSQFSDVPHSVRDSTGTDVFGDAESRPTSAARPLTGMSAWSSGPSPLARTSQVSLADTMDTARDSMASSRTGTSSMLDGIVFMAPSTGSAPTPPPGSPMFPAPPPRQSALFDSPEQTTRQGVVSMGGMSLMEDMDVGDSRRESSASQGPFGDEHQVEPEEPPRTPRAISLAAGMGIGPDTPETDGVPDDEEPPPPVPDLPAAVDLEKKIDASQPPAIVPVGATAPTSEVSSPPAVIAGATAPPKEEE